MKSLSLAVFFVAVAAASAGLHGYGGPAVIAGPAGAVITSGVSHGAVLAGTGVYGAGHGLGVSGGAIIAPATSAGYIAAPGLGYGYAGLAGLAGLGGHGLYGVGSGLEGQYIPDHSEKLYDDGSYKPYVYGH